MHPKKFDSVKFVTLYAGQTDIADIMYQLTDPHSQKLSPPQFTAKQKASKKKKKIFYRTN